ncbi:MAG: TRAP transporter small permease [Thiolinea sp.]
MLAQVVNKLRLIESVIATLAYAFVAGLLIVDVVGRELFGATIMGSQQLAVYGAIIAGFLGLTLATSDNSHLRPGFMDFLFKRFEPKIQQLGDALSASFFFVSACVAWMFVSVSMDNQDKAPVLYFVVWPLQLVLPYAFISSGLKHLIFALRPELKPAAHQGGH